MEFTFTREASYSLDLNAAQLKELAKHLGLAVAKLKKMSSDELYEQYSDEIIGWLDDQHSSWETTDEGQIDNLEIHV